MKSIVKTASALMFGLLFTAASFAQQPVKVEVPFEFSVGKHTLPAGEYRITQVAPSALSLRGENNSVVVVTIAQPIRSQSTSRDAKVTFATRDGYAALSEVWTDGANGYKLLVPKRRPTVAQNQMPATEAQTITSSYTGK